MHIISVKKPPGIMVQYEFKPAEKELYIKQRNL